MGSRLVANRKKSLPITALTVFFAVALLIVRTSGVPVEADEAQGNAMIVIHVEDDVSKRAIRWVSIRIVTDDREYEGLTDATGTVRFPNIPPGVYGIFAAEPDFAFAKTYALTAKPDAGSSVTILGTRTHARLIGSVQSRTELKPDAATSQTLDSASALLTGSVGASLGSVTSIGSQPAAPLTIHNEGAALTAATVNGAPLFGSGSKVPLTLFSADIFSSASVGSGTIGAPDGSLNFQTYEPVIDWGGILQGRIAPFKVESRHSEQRRRQFRSEEPLGALASPSFMPNEPTTLPLTALPLPTRAG